MKKIKLFAATAMMAMVATAGYFGYSAYEQANMTDAERMMMANLEALTRDETDGGGYKNAKNQYCAIPEGKEGCVDSPFRNCNNDVFCIR